MKTIPINIENVQLDFETARNITMSLARGLNPETSLMAWFDRNKSRHSPSEVECDAKDITGWEEYGAHHGGQEKFVINNGEYIFIYT
jgi:hypothetical protein